MAPYRLNIFECLVIREWYYLTRIRSYGLVVGNVAGVDFEGLKSEPRPSGSLFLLIWI